MRAVKHLIVLLVLLASVNLWAAIAYVGGAKANGSSGPTTVTYSPSLNNYVVMFAATASGAVTPYCQDNNLNTMSMGPQIATIGSVTLWSFYAIAASGATSYACYWEGVDNVSLVLGEYSGVSGINVLLANNTGTATSGTAQLTVTTEDANDWVVYGFGDSTNAFTATAGNARQTESSSPTAILLDQTSVSAGSVMGKATLTSSTWNGIALELRTVTPTPPVWSMVQMTPAGFSGNANCNVTASNTCTFPIAAIGSGHVLALMMADSEDSASSPQVTLASVYDCTSPPCNSSNTINAWVLPGSSCQATGNTLDTSNTDCAYVLSSLSGATYITATRSTHVTNERWGPTLIELNSTQTPVSLDNGNSPAATYDATGSLTHTVVATTLSGANDAIVQSYAGPDGATLVSFPYYQNANYNHLGFALSLNTASGIAPTWTSTSTHTGGAGSALAFTYGAAAVTNPPHAGVF